MKSFTRAIKWMSFTTPAPNAGSCDRSDGRLGSEEYKMNGPEGTCRLTAAAKLLQSCPTLWDSIDGSLPGSPVPGILRQEHWSGLPFPSPMHESEK